MLKTTRLNTQSESCLPVVNDKYFLNLPLPKIRGRAGNAPLDPRLVGTKMCAGVVL